jgi:hypothetical protein
MKSAHKFFLILSHALLASSAGIHAQGTFQNLNFESANVSAYGAGPAAVPTTMALPGWSSYTYGSPSSSIIYNTVSLGAAEVSLQGPGSHEHIIQGSYTVILQGSIGSTPGSAAIGQTGMIPEATQSLIFWGYAGLDDVSFDGQILPLELLNFTAQYAVYGANVSAYAGQTGQLLFTGQPNYEDFIDNIQFSPNVIPEPATWTLMVYGARMLALWRRNQKG